MKYKLNEIMTITEAAEEYKINVQTLKNKFKPSIVGQTKINEWIEDGLVRQSGKVWLLTQEFIILNFKIREVEAKFKILEVEGLKYYYFESEKFDDPNEAKTEGYYWDEDLHGWLKEVLDENTKVH